MKHRYPEISENCSKLPLWGDVQVGGELNALWSIRLRDNVCNQVIPPAFTSGPMRSGRYAVLSESRVSPLRQVNP